MMNEPQEQTTAPIPMTSEEKPKFSGIELDRGELAKRAVNDVETPLGEGLANENVVHAANSSRPPHNPRRKAKDWLAIPLAVVRPSLARVSEIAQRIMRFLRALVALGEMPDAISSLQRLADDQLSKSIKNIEQLRENDRVLLGMRETAAEQATRLTALASSFNAQVAALAARLSAPGTAEPASSLTSSDRQSPLLARLYSVIEDNFRGSRSDIILRQGVYLADVRMAIARTGSNIVLDLGCGRGEWLELLRRHGFAGAGVDNNAGQLAEARSLGLAVTEGDAYAFMKTETSNRFACVTSFHVAEHLPFDILALWLVEAFRILAPGGILILETPNPGNVVVGSSSFYLDPTHNKPLPTELLRVLARSVGFVDLETRFLHPHEHLKVALEGVPPDIAYLLFGYQDYAVIATKPTN